MKVSRKLFLLMALVALSLASVAVVGAADGDDYTCTGVGAATGGAILVDVPASLSTGVYVDQVQCRLFNGGADAAFDRAEAGTPINDQDTVISYGAIVGVDVWTASNRGATADFRVFDPPVRVCFKAASYGVDATAAVSPEDSAAGMTGPALVFSDARHYITERDSGSYGQISSSDKFTFSEGVRNVNQLNIVEAGREAGYICADLSWPGTVNLVAGLPGRDADDKDHPNYAGHTPDRCFATDTGALVGDCED